MTTFSPGLTAKGGILEKSAFVAGAEGASVPAAGANLSGKRTEFSNPPFFGMEQIVFFGLPVFGGPDFVCFSLPTDRRI